MTDNLARGVRPEWIPEWAWEATRRYVDLNTASAVPAHDDGGFCDRPDCYHCEIRRP